MSEVVRMRAIAAGGDGVGTLADGRAVFVPRTAPGDLAELTGISLARRFARARVARLVEPSPDRVVPRCAHYEGDECGGCQLQHLSGEAQRTVRRKLVGDALTRIGRLELPDPEITPSPREWSYRTKISLAARGRRIGYHRVGAPDQVFDLARCEIARPELQALWQAIGPRRVLLPGNLRVLVLRLGRDGSRHVIARVTGASVWTRARELGEALAAAGTPVVLWWEPEGGAPRAVFGAREAYPATVFEQVYPEMGDRVRRHALDGLGEVRGTHVWDLYAGIGETTRALAARGATVDSVEVDRRAVAVADARGPAAGVTRHAGRVEELLDRLRPPDGIIVNPPRAGLGEQVTDRLSARPIARVVYISCDPATLARDLARLRAAYRVTAVDAFDLFPQTAHVETVVVAERR
jgi:23S rRNA (uracil1939-C5)-methyltransferase